MRIANTQTNYFYGDTVFQGGLSALSGTTFTNTIFATTTALSIINNGTGPALYVSQAAGSSDVASFYDGDGVEVLHVGNAAGGGNPKGKVGINESDPDAELTVNGAISSNDGITVAGGTSIQWNSSRTTVNSNSAGWSAAANYFTTYPLLTTINYSPINLLGAINTNINLFNVPTGRIFIAKTLTILVIDAGGTATGVAPISRVANASRNNLALTNNNTLPTANCVIGGTNIAQNTGNTTASGGEIVAFRLTTAANNLTTLSASAIVEGYLI